MAQPLYAYWINDVSGDWSDGSNWSTEVLVPYSSGGQTYYNAEWDPIVPSGNYDVSLTPYNPVTGTATGTSPFTATYNATNDIYSLEAPTFATMVMAGGSLTLDQSISFQGNIVIKDGTVDDANAGGASSIGSGSTSGLDLAAGATLEVDAGVLYLGGGVANPSDPIDPSVIGSDIAGTISGAGMIIITGGESATIEAGAVLNVAGLDIAVNGDGSGSTLTLAGDLTYGGSFAIDNYGGNSAYLDLNGHTLTLSGSVRLDGQINGPGTLDLASGSTATLGSGGYALFNGAGGIAIVNHGTMNENQGFYLNGSFDNASGGTFDFLTDADISNEGAVAVTNEGILEKTGGSGDGGNPSYIYGSFTNSGTIDVEVGAVYARGSGGAISGTIEGAGEFDLGGGGTYTLGPNLAISVATLGLRDSGSDFILGQDLTYANDLVVSATFSPDLTLDLAGHTLTLTGHATFTAAYTAIDVTDGGTILFGPGSTASIDGTKLAGGVTIENAGTLTAGNAIVLDSDGRQMQTLIQNDESGVIDISATGTIFDNTGSSGQITNAGLIDVATASTNSSNVYDNLENTGTVTIDSGSLALYKGATLGGTVDGSGALTLRGGGSYYLESGLTLTVATLNVYDSGTYVALNQNFSYGGAFYIGGSFASPTLDLNGHTLTLTGTATFTAPYSTITLTDGTLEVAAGATASLDSLSVQGGVTIENAGTVYEYNNVDLDSDGAAAQSLFQNDAAGKLYLELDGNAFNENGSSGLISNAGLLDKVGGTGTSDVSVALDNTGTLEVDSGTIALHDGAMLNGTVTGNGTLTLRSGATYTFGTGLTLSIAYLNVYDGGTSIVLDKDVDYGGTLYVDGSFAGPIFNLNGHTLTVTDTATFTAPYSTITLTDGTLEVAAGATANLDSLSVQGGITIENAGTVYEYNNIALDSDGGAAQSLFQNDAAGKLYLELDGNAFNENGSSGLISNAGLLDKVGGAGTSDVSVALDNTGTLEVDSGTIALHDGAILNGTVTGNGTLTLRSGATYTFGTGLTLSIAHLNVYDGGTGIVLDKDFSYGGSLYVDGSFAGPIFNLNGHTLTVTDTATLTAPYSTITLTDGTLEVAAGATANLDSLSVQGGVTIENAGTVYEYNNIALDSDGAAAQSLFQNDVAGKLYLELDGNAFNENGSSGLISNAGLIDKVGGTGTSDVSVALDNTGTLEVDSGTIFLHDAVTNDGTLDAQSGTLVVGAALAVSAGHIGSITIGANGRVEFQSSVAADQTVNFASAGGTLQIDSQTTFLATVAGFVTGDVIDLRNVSYQSGDEANLLAGNVLEIIAPDESIIADLQLDPGHDYAAQFFHLAQNATTGATDVTVDTVACYCRGTLLLTNRGNVPVEALAIGDVLVTASGARRAIKWVGRRSYDGRFAMGNHDVLPICFKAGSLAHNVPSRDLWISPHHAMYFAEKHVLIEAKDLVNGVSIIQAEQVEKVEYYHVELNSHDIILAEGALSETFIDDNSRGMFHNSHEYWALYPDAITSSAHYCAPRVNRGYEMEAVRRGIACRAGLPCGCRELGGLVGHVDFVSRDAVAGWAQNVDHPEAPVCLDIFAEGRLIGRALANDYRADLAAARLGSGNHGFSFKPPIGLCIDLQTVEVRRSLDSAKLSMTEACDAQLRMAA